MTAPPRGSPPLPASSLPGRGPASRHHGRLRPAHPAPSGQGPARPAPRGSSGGWVPGATVTAVSLDPAPSPPPTQSRRLPRAGGVVMGPGPLQWRSRPAPPLTKLRHFRRVRLASAGRGMAALRSWLSRSVSSFLRYRRGVGVGGGTGGEEATQSARRGRCAGLAGVPFPPRPAPLSGPRTSRLGGAGLFPHGRRFRYPTGEREPPASRCPPGAARPAREFPLLSSPAGGGSVPGGQKGPGSRAAPAGPGVVGGDYQTLPAGA